MSKSDLKNARAHAQIMIDKARERNEARVDIFIAEPKLWQYVFNELKNEGYKVSSRVDEGYDQSFWYIVVQLDEDLQ